MGYETLKDGSSVLLRPPTADDLERYVAFFRSLPSEERRYLRCDVVDRDLVQRLLQAAENGVTHRMIALVDDAIVGQGILEYDPNTWQRHLGEIRVIVAQSFRHRSLGSLLISAMTHMARQRGLAVVIVKIPAPQDRVVKLCERLGFHFDALLKGHIVDRQGKVQDLIVMSLPLDNVSTALRDFCRDDNWPDG